MPDIADVAWSERDDRNSEPVPAGWPQGSMPAYVDQTGRMMMGATKRFWNKINPVYATTGSGDNYVVQTEVGVDQINLYELLTVRIDRSNVGTTPTLQFGSTNPRTIVKAGGSGYVPLAAGDLFAGNDHSFWYNGAFYILSDPAIIVGGTVQPYSPNLTAWSAVNPSSYSTTAQISAAYQPLDSDLTSWASVTRATGFDTFAAAPSSANFLSLLTTKTGTGSSVFNTNAVMSGTFTLGQDPVGSLEAATKQYVDNVAAGLDVKPSARLATTANITLSATQTIDGVSAIAGDRVLVKTQTTTSQNGIYVVAAGTWTRASDMDSWTEVPGANVWVEEGTSNADTAWVCTSNAGGTIGTTAITWTQFGGSGTYQPASANLTSWAAITRAAAVDTFANTGVLPLANLALGTSGFALMGNGASASSYQGFMQPVGSSPTTRTWQSKTSDFVSIVDYGAIGDGNISNASINATALTNALATGKQVWIPWTAAGYHFGTNQIPVGTGQVILGESQVLLLSTATTSLFRLTGFDLTSGIHNVSIDMTGSGASSTAIRFGTNSGTPVYRVRFSKLRFANCVEAIGDEVHATNYVVDVIIDDCMAWKTRGRQMYIRRSRGFFLIRSTNVDFTQDSAPVAWEGIRLEDFAGLELERVDVVGWGTGTRAYNGSLYGIVINNGQALWLTRVFVDSYLGVGIFINAASYMFSNYLETSLCNGLGILLTTVSKGVFANTLINGNTGVTGAAAGAQGLYLDTCTDLTFGTTLAYNMTGSVIAAVNANNRITFTGTVTNTNGFGLAIQGTSANVKFLGGSMNGNTTAVSNTASGAGNVIKDITGYNPVGAASVTTSASPYTYTAGASPETLYFSASTGISAITQSGGTSILPAALAANVPMTVDLDPGQAVVITYTGTLAAKKMVH
ncbi:hypothetical protein [Mesorhizobium sp. NZP2077]|uniref:hypothetical protein n=1 Tax=Mesorhizobium sp. NZP2077 TaxID=2483404 RepID=UPI0015569D9A|nr:hypothetical protein [Mesorhizobium sp. NZP2077]QKC81529.1 hypothetical protein EB232_07605 [Mesorhizobium sp. NZP2077]QKD14979.1 hypothetical protein HGP13_07500 [Mesorhizobium sp. NZP2077]